MQTTRSVLTLAACQVLAVGRRGKTEAMPSLNAAFLLDLGRATLQKGVGDSCCMGFGIWLQDLAAWLGAFLRTAKGPVHWTADPSTQDSHPDHGRAFHD